MNYSLALLLASFFALASIVAAYGIYDNPIVVKKADVDPSYLQKIRGLRQNVLTKGCPLNLCFAIDGSGSIRPSQFEDEKNFADLIMNIVTTDDPGNYAAVQYGTSNRAISPLTKDRAQVVRKLFRTRKVGGLSNIAGGLGYCGFQLRGQLNYPKKLIIIGDGFASIGFTPAFVAKSIRKDGVSICAVAVGPSDIDGLVSITGDIGRVVTLEGFFEIAEIIIAIVNNACSF